MIVFDISSFFGRFHPLVVHLPIGFILLAIFLEIYAGYKKISFSRRIISFCWFLGFISSLFAALFGWLLASNGYYIEENIYIHRWSGILIVFLSLIGWGIKARIINLFKSQDSFINYTVLILLLIVGHHGGNITHGENYLFEYAPDFLKKYLYKEKNQLISYKEKEIDSIEVFTELILPVFENKCIACHNSDIPSGGLNMVSLEKILVGGAAGSSIIDGNSLNSPIFKRITLSQSHSKFMPPSGEPLTYDEINLIQWWINNGVKNDIKLIDIELSNEEESLLARLFEIDTKPKPWYEKLKNLEELNLEELKKLEDKNLSWKQLANNYPVIEIKFNGNKITDNVLSEILKFNKHVISLTIKNSSLNDSQLNIISQLENLMILNIQNNPLSDDGITNLNSLNHLERLNLYGTNVSDLSLETFTEIKSLKKIYLWNTKVSKEKIDEFNRKNKSKEALLDF
tara:strand:+ start:1225 stop:2595 length:1371 start_codon:yes stop_codon:yes gene_type:complete